MPAPIEIAVSSESGRLGVQHLKRLWSAAMSGRSGAPCDRHREWACDRLLLDALGIGEHQAFEYLFQWGPTFAEFEDWVVATAGMPTSRTVERINAAISGAPANEAVRQWLQTIEDAAPVLGAAELSCWQTNGYVVLENAVPPSQLAVAGKAGDLIIWHPFLPHGSRPNLGTRPRLVQYINMYRGSAAP